MIDAYLASDLLDECRMVMVEQLLPALPANLHYEARMIASALSRVARQITQSRRAAAIEMEEIDALLAGRTEPRAVANQAPDRSLEDGLDALRATLCRAVREGQFDARLENPGDILRLRNMVHAKLLVTNPKLISEAS